MVDTTTPNYGLVLVQIGASRDTWGDKLNANFTAIDTDLKAVSVLANAALPSATYTAANVLSKLLTVDGAGSGLDADTVDGINAASFQLASGYTAADVLSKLLTVDGPGSTLDADTLDGVQGAGYALVGHNHDATYLKLTAASQTITGALAVTGAMTVTGALTHNAAGVFPYFAAAGITGGVMTISTAAGSDPTANPGDMWLGY